VEVRSVIWSRSSSEPSIGRGPARAVEVRSSTVPRLRLEVEAEAAAEAVTPSQPLLRWVSRVATRLPPSWSIPPGQATPRRRGSHSGTRRQGRSGVPDGWRATPVTDPTGGRRRGYFTAQAVAAPRSRPDRQRSHRRLFERELGPRCAPGGCNTRHPPGSGAIRCQPQEYAWQSARRTSPGCGGRSTPVVDLRRSPVRAYLLGRARPPSRRQAEDLAASMARRRRVTVRAFRREARSPTWPRLSRRVHWLDRSSTIRAVRPAPGVRAAARRRAGAVRDARERDLTRIAWDAVVGVTSATSVGPPRFLQSGEAGLVRSEVTRTHSVDHGGGWGRREIDSGGVGG
jgi:hypothetical protein